MKVLFAPDHTPEMEIMKQMLKATSEVDFAISPSPGRRASTTRCSRCRGGSTIAGRARPGQGAQRVGRDEDLNQADIELSPEAARRRGCASSHHKLMVIDETVVVAG